MFNNTKKLEKKVNELCGTVDFLERRVDSLHETTVEIKTLSELLLNKFNTTQEHLEKERHDEQRTLFLKCLDYIDKTIKGKDDWSQYYYCYANESSIMNIKNKLLLCSIQKDPSQSYSDTNYCHSGLFEGKILSEKVVKLLLGWVSVSGRPDKAKLRDMYIKKYDEG